MLIITTPRLYANKPGPLGGTSPRPRPLANKHEAPGRCMFRSQRATPPMLINTKPRLYANKREAPGALSVQVLEGHAPYANNTTPRPYANKSGPPGRPPSARPRQPRPLC